MQVAQKFDKRPPAYPALAAECARRGIKYAALARVVGVHPNTITNVVSGQQRPSAELRLRIAAALGAERGELFVLNTEALT